MEIPVEYIDKNGKKWIIPISLLEELIKIPVNCTEKIPIEYIENNEEKWIISVSSLEELIIVIKKSWADRKQRFPKNIRLVPIPSPLFSSS